MIAAAVVSIAGWMLLRFEGSDVDGFDRIERQPLFSSLHERIDDIRQVRILGPLGTLPLTRSSSQSWRLGMGDGYPVPAEKVEKLIESIAELAAVYRSSTSELDYRRYGVSQREEVSKDSGLTVALLDGDTNPLATVTFGDSITVSGSGDTRMRSLRVVKRGGDSGIWLVEGDYEIATTPLEWVDQTVIDIPLKKVVEFEAVEADKRTFTFRGTGDGEFVADRERSSSLEKVEGPWVPEQMVLALGNLEFLDVRAAVGIEVLAGRPWQSTVKTDQGITYRIRVYRTPTGAWSTFFAVAAEDGAMREALDFNTRHATWAYLLAPYTVRRLTMGTDQIEK